MTSRIQAQFNFLLEADKLRSVERQNLILDCSRPENSAEHSWHLALYALALVPMAGDEVQIERVIKMLLLHDLVEIDAGDHPIDEEHDWNAVEKAEQKAAERLFGLLPDDQAAEFHALWSEFEAAESADSRFAKQLDHCQPIFQTLCAEDPIPEHVEVVRNNLFGGRAARLEHSQPLLFKHAVALLERAERESDTDLEQRLAFLNEADALKLILRATRLGDGSRRENSAEHSWHIMLYAWVLSEYASSPIDPFRVLQMLLLHDIVEIDAGDSPIHGGLSAQELAKLEELELAAADRLFGLLPRKQSFEFKSLWLEFEAATSADAVFAKSIDRVQPLLLNLANGGGSWRDYDVSMPQLEQRVGVKVNRGAPDVWSFVKAKVEPWFAEQGRL